MLEDDAVFFTYFTSATGNFAAEGAPGQRLPSLRVLWLTGNGERRRAEDDDRDRQTAPFGKAPPERETEHHSDGA